MNENKRDAGLVRAVGPWALAASIFSIIVGAGIFAIPAALSASIGPYAPLAILFCAVAVGATAVCFAEGGSRVPTSGGAYGCIEAAFGPLIGYVAGTLLWVGCVLACGGVSAALADLVVNVVPLRFSVPAHAAVIVGVVGGIALVNIGGVGRGAGFASATTVLKLLPLVVFVLVGAFAMHKDNFVPTVEPSTHGLGRAVILSLFTWIGMETPLSASGEVRDPSRTIPRALLIALTSVAFLYIAIQVIAQGILGAALAHSSASLADAMAQVSPSLRLMMVAGAVVSMFGWISADILGSPRMLFALGREGLLPRVLGRVHRRTHAPHVAILVYAALAIVLALTGTFAELAVLATLPMAVLYCLACAAAWLLARRGVALAGAPLNFRWLAAAALIGIGSMLVMILLASMRELLALLALISLSAVAYAVSKWTLLTRASV